FDQSGAEPGRFGFIGAARAAAQADDHVDPAVVEVERLRSSLIAVAEDRNPLAGERRGIDVGFAEQVHSGGTSRSPGAEPAPRPGCPYRVRPGTAASRPAAGAQTRYIGAWRSAW